MIDKNAKTSLFLSLAQLEAIRDTVSIAINSAPCDDALCSAYNEVIDAADRNKREQCKVYVRYVVDDALNGRRLGSDPHAIIREAGIIHKYGSVLVGYVIGTTPVFVAVHSYLDVCIDGDEAIAYAGDYLREIGVLSANSLPPAYVL